MKTQSLGILLLIGFASSAPLASAQSRTPWLAMHRDGNPNGRWMKEHNRNLLNKEAMSRVDWIMVGDSLTAGWRTEGQETLDRYFHGRNILNLGVDGDATQHVLWRIGHGEVYGMSPKLITVMVGRENITNDHCVKTWVGRSDGKILAGIKAVVEALENRCPAAKIVVLSNLHRDAVAGEPILESIEQTNELVKTSAKIRGYTETDRLDMSFIRKRVDEINNGLSAICQGKENVLYVDIHDKFLDEKGQLLKAALKPDLQHLNEAGYEIWAKAIAPTVQEIMGDVPKQHRANTPGNRNNGHHQKDLADKKQMGQVDLVFIGDSITHGWDNVVQPNVPGGNRAGKAVWDRFYGNRKALNYGIGGDRTYHALWRVQNGILDGISPKLIVLMMGVNNVGRKECTPQETAGGLEAILDEIHRRCPDSHILHLAVFPLAEQPYDPGRRRVDAINAHLPALAKRKAKAWDGGITYMSINDGFLNDDGTAQAELLPDFCHPSDKGYQVWAESIEPVVEKYLGKLP